jgi:hypothetical protein
MSDEEEQLLYDPDLLRALVELKAEARPQDAVKLDKQDLGNYEYNFSQT